MCHLQLGKGFVSLLLASRISHAEVLSSLAPFHHRQRFLTTVSHENDNSHQHQNRHSYCTVSHNPPFLTAGSKPHAVTEFSNLSTEIFFLPQTNPLTNELLLHGWEGHGGMDRALDDAEINSLVHTIPSGAQRPLLWPVACLVLPLLLLLLPSRLTPGGFACNTLLTQARPVSSCWMRARTSLCVCVHVCLVSSSRENPNQPKETHHSGSCLYKTERGGNNGREALATLTKHREGRIDDGTATTAHQRVLLFNVCYGGGKILGDTEGACSKIRAHLARSLSLSRALPSSGTFTLLAGSRLAVTLTLPSATLPTPTQTGGRDSFTSSSSSFSR